MFKKISRKISLLSILPSTDPASWSLKGDHNEVMDIMNNTLTLVAEIAGALAVFLIVWASFNYFMAFGNEEKVTAAKKMIYFVLAGLLLIILAKIIVAMIFDFLQ